MQRGLRRWRGEAGGLYLPSSPHTQSLMMSVTLSHLRSMELLSTSARDLIRQRTQLSNLMAFMVIFGLINPAAGSIILDQPSVQSDSSILLSVSAMPRLRGTPRRGARWYAAASRRKRHKAFQHALSLARRRRRQASRAVISPPGTVIEEDPSTHLPLDYSHQRLVTYPDDWDPLARVFRIAPPSSTASEQAMESVPGPAPCTIEEEREMEVEPVQREENPCPVDAPLPLEHLTLIFGLRSLVEDLNFRVVCTNQRLDLLLTAHSCASPKQRCPTCAQPYAIPTRAPSAQADEGSSG
jgi:hypothetical protein